MDSSNSKKPVPPVRHVERGDESISGVVSQLIKLVLAMPIEEQRRLLADLKTRKGESKRNTPRKSYFASVQFTAAGLLYSGYITDISPTGVYIEAPATDLKRLSHGEAVILIFQHPDTKANIKLTAKITRIDQNGIGVRFNQNLEDLLP